MTVEAQNPDGSPIVRSGPYLGNGVTTMFDYDFPILADHEVAVVRQNADLTEDVLELTTDYTVTGVGNDSGGSVILNSGSLLPTGAKLVLLLNMAFDQTTAYSNQGRIKLELLEASLDKLTLACRQLLERVQRAVNVDAFGTTDIATLRANIDALAAIETQIVTVAGSIADVTTLATNIADVTTVAADIADIKAARDAALAGNTTRADMVALIAGGFIPDEGRAYHLDGGVYVGRTGATGITDLPGLVEIGGAEGADSWAELKAPEIVGRSRPRFLMPEMYIGLETQLIYAPAQVGGDPYAGATDFSPAFAAMRQEIEDITQTSEWPETGTVPAVAGLQPGLRYRITQAVPFHELETTGFTFDGHNGQLVWDSIGGTMIDCIGTELLTLRNLRLESDSNRRPNYGIIFGRSGTGTRERNLLDHVSLHGWYDNAAVYNYASEIFGANRLTVYNYMAGASCLTLDVLNAEDIEPFTAATMSVPANTPASFNDVLLTQADLRSVQGSEDGTIRMISPHGHTQKARMWKMINCYATSGGGSGNTDPRPAVVMKGDFDSIHMDLHCEPYVDTTRIRLSHNVLFDNTDGDQLIRSFHYHDHLSDAQIAVFDAKSTAHNITITGAEIDVPMARGRNTSSIRAPLFGPNSTTTSVQGVFKVGNDQFMNDFSHLAAVSGIIYSDANLSQINIPAGSAPMIDTASAPIFKQNRSLTYSGPDASNINFDGYDTIIVTGTVATITGFTATNSNRTRYLINGRASPLTVTTVDGDTIVPPGKCLILYQQGTVFRAAGAPIIPASGWTAATGTASRTTFDTASVTTPQLAERVKALIDDLIAKKVLGA